MPNHIKKILLPENLKKFIFPVSIIILASLAALGSSPFYLTNPWDDSNAMLTMGRSFLHGILPFKDAVDQRGPFLYFIFAIAALIKNNSFLGVYIVELINILVVYYFTYRIVKIMTPDGSKQPWIAIIGPIVLFGTSAFYLGGAPEEFAFTSVLYLLFTIVRSNYDLLRIQTKQLAFIGLNFGFVFWNKYSMIGPFIVFFILLTFYSVKKISLKDYFLKLVLPIFIGFSLVSAIILFFFVLSNGLNDLIQVYFVQNMAYGNTPSPFLFRYIASIAYIAAIVGMHTYVLIILAIGWFLGIKNSQNIFPEIIIFIGSILIMAIPRQYTDYYNLIWLPLLVFALIRIVNSLLNSKVETLHFNNKNRFFAVLATVLVVFLPFVNNTQLGRLIVKGTDKAADYGNRNSQELFAKIMLQKTNSAKPSLVMLNSLDDGFFLATQSLPTTRFWHKLNMTPKQMPEMYADFNETLSKQKVQFVVIRLKERPATSVKLLKEQIKHEVDPSLVKNLECNYDISAISANRDNLGYVLLQSKEMDKSQYYISKLN
ncbi:hypothetical protein [Fructobacillus durionis]|uniref:Glycosyltransferase RgtA/B/C/D-like domain-containing protein n=1 Tax=Fructobacillus durionis TaxID=283737 RepID=A0A1I1E8P7_9LACO|nr:hypothetical protein [Fructobacillus durionis]SFB81370.1 hypothetical protein SAMN05660453_0261 [Fructobacillus durionis]